MKLAAADSPADSPPADFTTLPSSSTPSTPPTHAANSAHGSSRASRPALRWPANPFAGQKRREWVVVAMEGKPQSRPLKPALRLQRLARYLHILRTIDTHHRQPSHTFEGGKTRNRTASKSVCWSEHFGEARSDRGGHTSAPSAEARLTASPRRTLPLPPLYCRQPPPTAPILRRGR